MPHARSYIETAIRLGGLINTMGTGKALDAALRQPDGSARMESIAPRLGQGLATANVEPIGRPFAQPRLSDGRLLDDVLGYAPVLLVGDALLETVEKPAITTLTALAEPAVAACLEEFGASAVLVRPDRYVLGVADTPQALTALVSHADSLFAVAPIPA